MIQMKWKYLKALNDLYIYRQTSINIESQKDDEGQFIKRRLIDGLYLIQKRPLKNPIWVTCNGFDEYYEKHHKDNFVEYQNFFVENEIEHSAAQTFKEKDIRRLFLIKSQKKQILEKKPSQKEFLSEFMDEEAKYFDNDNISLKKAVLQILGIDEFEGDDEKTNQWRLVIDCPKAKCVVLCENKDRLTITKRPLENLIELWYVGGNNIPPLERLEDKLILPVFYSCDWDYAGLQIFSRVKKIIENLNGKIYLLIPAREANRFPTISKNHSSDWHYNKDLSGLSKEIFSLEAQTIIKSLIQEKKYIQEEGLDLIEMVNEAMTNL
jgi:hypothetical protein